MSREKQIELLERQLAFWKHHCTVLSNALTKEEEISNRYAEMLDKTEEELNAERVKQEWISVDERLPEHSQKVLVCDDRQNMVTAMYVTFDNGGFDWCTSVRLVYEVTHWMPLPEPPKMKGDPEK